LAKIVIKNGKSAVKTGVYFYECAPHDYGSLAPRKSHEIKKIKIF